MTSILGINVENISTKENIVNKNTNINISATNLKNVIDTCQEIKNELSNMVNSINRVSTNINLNATQEMNISDITASGNSEITLDQKIKSEVKNTNELIAKHFLDSDMSMNEKLLVAQGLDFMGKSISNFENDQEVEQKKQSSTGQSVDNQCPSVNFLSVSICNSEIERNIENINMNDLEKYINEENEQLTNISIGNVVNMCNQILNYVNSSISADITQKMTLKNSIFSGKSKIKASQESSLIVGLKNSMEEYIKQAVKQSSSNETKAAQENKASIESEDTIKNTQKMSLSNIVSSNKFIYIIIAVVVILIGLSFGLKYMPSKNKIINENIEGDNKKIQYFNSH